MGEGEGWDAERQRVSSKKVTREDPKQGEWFG